MAYDQMDNNYADPNTQSVDYSGWQLPPGGGGGINPNTGVIKPPEAPASNPFNYEQARDSWMSGKYGGGAGGAAAWASANGVNYNGGDTISLPNGGGMIDIIGNYAGGKGNGQAMTNNWTAAGGNGPNPNGVNSGGGGSNGGNAGGFNSGQTSALNQQLVQMLLGRANQSLNVNAQTDPNIRQQADPYAANVQRQARNYIADQAERLGPNANIQGEARLANERAGQASGQFEASLVGGEINARRQEIQAALSGLQGYLSDQDRLSLQQELGHLSDATQRYGIDTNANTANNRLGLDAEQQYNYWDALRSGQL